MLQFYGPTWWVLLMHLQHVEWSVIGMSDPVPWWFFQSFRILADFLRTSSVSCWEECWSLRLQAWVSCFLPPAFLLVSCILKFFSFVYLRLLCFLGEPTLSVSLFCSSHPWLCPWVRSLLHLLLKATPAFF